MTRGKSGSSSQSEDRIGRELMTPDEVGRMDNKECIVMIRGEYPIKGKKLDATKHKRAQQSGLFGKPYFHRKSQSIQWKDVSEILAKTQFKKTYMDVIVKAVEAESPEKIVKSYIWDAMNEEEKEQGDNKLRDLDGNEIKNDNVPQKGVQ